MSVVRLTISFRLCQPFFWRQQRARNNSKGSSRTR